MDDFAKDTDVLISRQAAVEALETLCETVCEYSKKQRAVMCGACPLGGAFDVLSNEPSAQPEQRWTPVTERLPEPPSFCLVTTDGSHNDVIDIALFMSDGWHKASTILAWMPLPKPYERSEDE